MEAPTTLGNTLTFGLAREMSPEYNNGGFGGALRHDLPQSDDVDIGTESCGLRQSSDASQNAIFINQFPSPRGRGAAADAGVPAAVEGLITLDTRINEGDLLGLSYHSGTAIFAINGREIARVEGLEGINLAGVTLPTG